MRKYNYELIEKDFLNGMKIPDITKKYNTGYCTIYTILKKLDLKINKRIYTLDENYFEKIDSYEKAYILGLITADGSVSNDGVHISLMDLDAIEYLKKCLNFSGPIKIVNPRKETHSIQYRLDMYSVKLVKDLSKHGVIQNKTHHCIFPNISNKLISSFICGYFDGDGGICLDKNKRCSISFTGNDLIILKIKDILLDNNIINPQINIRKKETPNIISLLFSGYENILNLMKYIYSKVDFKMKRKYDTFSLIYNTNLIRVENYNIKLENIKIRENNKKEIKELKKNNLDNFKNNLVELYLIEKKSIREISDVLNIRRATISKYLKDKNVAFRDKSFYDDKKLENLRNYYK